MKEAKILETTVQKCFCLVKLAIFSPDELGKKKDLATAQQNIEWLVKGKEKKEGAKTIFFNFKLTKNKPNQTKPKGICNLMLDFWNLLLTEAQNFVFVDVL